MSNPWDPAALGHTIDTLTGQLPDDLTRTEIATLIVANRWHGQALGLTEAADHLAGDPAAMRQVATVCQRISDGMRVER